MLAHMIYRLDQRKVKIVSDNIVTIVPANTAAGTVSPPFDWRAHLDVHPAAQLFPPLPESELKELADDIKANGLRAPIVVWAPSGGRVGPVLLDGVNRLDALARLDVLYETPDHHIGLRAWNGSRWLSLSGDRIHFDHVFGGDPYALALSYNLHRRHLTNEHKRDLIAKVLKAKPEASNLRVAKQVKADDKTVAKVRTELEGRSEIPNVEKRADTKGREQPARKLTSAPKVAAAEPVSLPPSESSPKPAPASAPAETEIPQTASTVQIDDLGLFHNTVTMIDNFCRIEVPVKLSPEAAAAASKKIARVVTKLTALKTELDAIARDKTRGRQ